MSGYQLVSSTSTQNGAGNKTVTVSCPTGKVALGGGAYSTTDLVISASYPTSGGWTITFRRATGTSGYDVTGYASCVSVG